MQVTKESVSPCEVALEIDVESDAVSRAVDQAYKEFSRMISVPGFRKGKAPMTFVKQRVPNEQLRERTVEILVAPAYQEALKQESVTPYSSPELSLVALDTEAPEQKFKFKAVVPLPPQVELSSYKGLSGVRHVPPITEKQVDERIDYVRKRRAEIVTVDRASQMGDILKADVTVTPEGASEPGPVRSTVIEIGEPDNLPEIDENLIGLKAGDDKAFQVHFPDDFPEEESRGKNAGFYVVVNEVQEQKLPVLDDEFAKQYGNDSVEEYRNAVRQALERVRDTDADNRLETELVDQLAATSKIDYPRVMLDREVQADLKDFVERLDRQGVNLDTYLEETGLTREQVVEEFEKRADVRLKRALVLGTIATKEEVKVTDEDISEEIARRAALMGAPPEAMRAYLESRNELALIPQSLITKKVLGLITGSAIIEDRTLETDEPLQGGTAPASAAAAEEPKKAKPRTRKPKAETSEG